jgi:hypothetical protein
VRAAVTSTGPCCSRCHQPGHNIRTCPLAISAQYSSSSSSPASKPAASASTSNVRRQVCSVCHKSGHNRLTCDSTVSKPASAPSRASAPAGSSSLAPQRACSRCHQPGHNIRTCPLAISAQYSSSSSSPASKPVASASTSNVRRQVCSVCHKSGHNRLTCDSTVSKPASASSSAPQRACSACRKPGHNIRTCPTLTSSSPAPKPAGSASRSKKTSSSKPASASAGGRTASKASPARRQLHTDSKHAGNRSRNNKSRVQPNKLSANNDDSKHLPNNKGLVQVASYQTNSGSRRKLKVVNVKNRPVRDMLGSRSDKLSSFKEYDSSSGSSLHQMYKVLKSTGTIEHASFEQWKSSLRCPLCGTVNHHHNTRSGGFHGAHVLLNDRRKYKRNENIPVYLMATCRDCNPSNSIAERSQVNGYAVEIGKVRAGEYVDYVDGGKKQTKLTEHRLEQLAQHTEFDRVEPVLALDREEKRSLLLRTVLHHSDRFIDGKPSVVVLTSSDNGASASLSSFMNSHKQQLQNAVQHVNLLRNPGNQAQDRMNRQAAAAIQKLPNSSGLPSMFVMHDKDDVYELICDGDADLIKEALNALV